MHALQRVRSLFWGRFTDPASVSPVLIVYLQTAVALALADSCQRAVGVLDSSLFPDDTHLSLFTCADSNAGVNRIIGCNSVLSRIPAFLEINKANVSD